MSTTTISITEAKKRWTEVVRRVAYNGERILLLSRGKPKAALVSTEDLRQLESISDEQRLRKANRREALAMADALRTRILARTGGTPLSDSVQDLQQLRGERLCELTSDL